MTCSCGHEFCWYCLKDYKYSESSLYEQHNQKDCLLLLLIKVITLVFCFFSLLLVYSGNEFFNTTISYGWRILVGILRAVAIDGAIAVQFMILTQNSHRRNQFRRLAVLFAIMDIIALIVIYLIGDLAMTFYIIGLSLATAGVSVGIGMMVEFSVATWFQYIR